MAHCPSPGAIQIEDTPAFEQKTAGQLEFLRLLVLYIINSFTGTALTVIKKLGIDKVLQKATPTLRIALAVLVRKCGDSYGPDTAQV